MDKLLIGVITVLILLALIPSKSEPFTSTNLVQVTTSIADDAEEIQPLFIRLEESKQLDNSELMTMAENVETDKVEIEIEQEMAGNDRGIFISIGSILLFVILLLLPLHIQKL